MRAFTAAAAVVLIVACSDSESVKEYFRSHGMDYPADVSRVGLLSMSYAGVERDELMVEGAREFVQEGIMFIKVYFKKGNVGSVIPGINAIIVEKPVLFRDESGGVGLMVAVRGFGTGERDHFNGIEIEWMGRDRRFWKVENFAYFNRNDMYRWQFGGWVYPFRKQALTILQQRRYPKKELRAALPERLLNTLCIVKSSIC